MRTWQPALQTGMKGSHTHVKHHSYINLIYNFQGSRADNITPKLNYEVIQCDRNTNVCWINVLQNLLAIRNP